jgi:hypothetical protein
VRIGLPFGQSNNIDRTFTIEIQIDGEASDGINFRKSLLVEERIRLAASRPNDRIDPSIMGASPGYRAR